MLGSGPSMNLQLMQSLCNEETIVLNSTVYDAIEAQLDRKGILFFGDGSWGLSHSEVIQAWRGRVITSARFAYHKIAGRLEFVQAVPSSDFPKPPAIRKGPTSGHLAIGLAVSLGATRIVLHGFDMQTVNGRSHHHTDYKVVNHSSIYLSFIARFAGWNRAAQRAGVEIWNATPRSALNEFELVGNW